MGLVKNCNECSHIFIHNFKISSCCLFDLTIFSIYSIHNECKLKKYEDTEYRISYGILDKKIKPLRKSELLRLKEKSRLVEKTLKNQMPSFYYR